MPDNTITPPPPWATRSTTLTSVKRSLTRRHTCCLLSALHSENQDSSVKRTPLQSARRHWMWAFAHLSQLWRRTAVRSRSRWGRKACRWASLRRFLTDCAEIIWLCKPIVLLNSLKRLGRRLMEDKWTFIFMGNSSGGYSCSQHANWTLPQNLRHLWHCAVWKTLHILEWPFNMASLRHTCAIIMLSNQHLDMLHLWGGWIIPAKEKCSLTQI